MLKKFVPQLNVASIYDIDLQALQDAGVKGLIADLDNTLVGAEVASATPELKRWLERVSELGFKFIVVSNNSEDRVSIFSEPLKLPFISRAQKPRKAAFQNALDHLKLDVKDVAMIGDQMLTDVFGGNRMGLYTILVRAISLDHEGFFTRINRRIEKKMLARLERQGIKLWEDQ